MLNCLIIIQARISSKRLPGKVLLSSNNQTILLKSQIKRILIIKKKLNIKGKIIVACPEKDVGIFQKHFKKNIFYGPEENVLQRFYLCAKKYNAKKIIRITGDDPLVTIDSFRIIMNCLKKNFTTKKRLISMWHTKKVPHGTNISFIDYEALKIIYESESSKLAKEHVILVEKSKKKINLILPKIPKYLSKSKIKFCIDTIDDYRLYRMVDIKYNEALNFLNLELKYREYY